MFEKMNDLAKRLEDIREEQANISNELHAMIKVAHEAGLSVTYIAKTLGVTRQTVYTNLK